MRSQNNQQGGGSTTDRSERAVSPVVGVAILVGITVILASVVGAFVFGLVNIGESSPDASFTFSQNTANFSTDAGNDPLDGADRKLKTVRVTHNSGESIAKSNLVAKVSGNKSEPQSNDSVYTIVYNNDTGEDEWSLVLNESNSDREILQSGDSFSVGMYGYSRSAIAGQFITDYNVTDSNPPTAGIGIDTGSGPSSQASNNPNPPKARKLGECDMLEIVWRSDSGAQGQVLQSYQLSGTACT